MTDLLLLLLKAVEILQPPSTPTPDPGEQHSPLDKPSVVDGQTRSTNNSQAADMAPKNHQDKLSTDGHLSAQDVLGLRDINAGGPSASSQMQARWGSSHEPGAYKHDKAAFGPLSHVPGAQTIKSRGRYRDIRDYVMALTKSPDTDSCGSRQVGNAEFTLKDSKPSWDKIHVTHYKEASLSILREMIQEDNPLTTQIMEYIQYATKVARLAQVFKWDSVLTYGREYRKLQAEMRSPWGADSSYLMQLHLKPHTTTQKTGTSRLNMLKPRPTLGAAQLVRGPRRNMRNRYDPNTGQVISQRFNGTRAMTGKGVNFPMCACPVS